MPQPPRVLLGTAAAGGTIAAVRCLAQRGFAVDVASSGALDAAAWSRHTARSYRVPRECKPHAYIDRILAIGAREPGRILLPTSDETAWQFAEHARDLANVYKLYLPPLAVMRTLLDKTTFSAAARAAGVRVLPQWDPADERELLALAPHLPYPVLIKPRTHVHRRRNDKGVVVRTADELRVEYAAFSAREGGRTADTKLLIESVRPVLQPFVDVRERGVRSITGFVDKTGELYVTRHSRKVLQRSQPVGVGLCFEALPPDPDLSQAVRRFCRDIGYFGVFEVEFVHFDGAWRAIDFNPRLFHQIGLDIRRDMPTPLFACLAAAGDGAGLRAAVLEAQNAPEAEGIVFSDRFTLGATLLASRMLMSPTDARHWRGWTNRHANERVDVAIDRSDRLPGVVHAISETYLGLKALPRFLASHGGARDIMPPVRTKESW